MYTHPILAMAYLNGDLTLENEDSSYSTGIRSVGLVSFLRLLQVTYLQLILGAMSYENFSGGG